jgi:hypothetical protein
VLIPQPWLAYQAVLDSFLVVWTNLNAYTCISTRHANSTVSTTPHGSCKLSFLPFSLWIKHRSTSRSCISRTSTSQHIVTCTKSLNTWLYWRSVRHYPVDIPQLWTPSGFLSECGYSSPLLVTYRGATGLHLSLSWLTCTMFLYQIHLCMWSVSCQVMRKN